MGRHFEDVLNELCLLFHYAPAFVELALEFMRVEYGLLFIIGLGLHYLSGHKHKYFEKLEDKVRT